MKNHKKADKRSVVFYAAIALLTAGIIALGSLPYIMSRKGENVIPGENTGEYPPNGDGVDRYGRPDTSAEELRGVWVAYPSLDGVDKK